MNCPLRHLYKYIMCSLLGLLPLAAVGQTTAMIEGGRWTDVPRVRQHQGDGWWKVLTDGGMLRTSDGRWYMTMEEGVGDLVVMNYVDGYSFGPHASLGYISANRQRWELEETLRWASGRQRWLGKAALRWYSPIEQGLMLELHGGQHTEDYDRDPTMSTAHSLFATGVFGWNHYKLLERTDAGIRMSATVTRSIDLQAHASWERRRTMANHKERNMFGVWAESNVPRLRDGQTASDLRLYDGPTDGELALVGLQMTYQPHRKLYVTDDMTSQWYSPYPKMTFSADAGMGDWHYLSLSLGIEHEIALPLSADRLSYSLGGGGIIRHGQIGLADWHHLDASRFWWQDKGSLTRFVMLDNYELSTDQQWSEAHVEWSSGKMLLTQWITEPSLMREYVQVHAAKVLRHRMHWELQYGLDLVERWRLGLAIGMDGAAWRGVAFTMSLGLQPDKRQ